MRTPSYAKKFNKDTKLANKRKYDMQKLHVAMKMLENEIPLPPVYHEHPLHNNWNGSLECHIEPDWLLVYKIDDTSNEKRVYFERTGTHQDIFGW